MDADVCVIGSGAGGATVASELARLGKKTVLLEIGRRLDFRKDFADETRDADGLPASLKEGEAWLPYTSAPAYTLPAGHETLLSYNVYYPSARATLRPPARLLRGIGLGGSTLRFEACSDRWPADVFAGSGLEAINLAPWYAQAEDKLKVHGAMPYHHYPPHGPGVGFAAHAGPFSARRPEPAPLCAGHLGAERPALQAGRLRATQPMQPGLQVGFQVQLRFSPAGAGRARPRPERLTILTRAQATRLIPRLAAAGEIEAVEYIDFSNEHHPAGTPGRITAAQFVIAAGLA